MPGSAEAPRGELLVDMSVAVALAVVDHALHPPVAAALRGRTVGLSGHAAFETFSVLTRLPPPARRSPSAVARLIAATFPATVFPGPAASARLLAELDGLGIAGGSVYDALVAATALEHGMVLATCDRRALPTYRALNVAIELVA